MELKINAPAKVNLLLRVLGSRPDGYHELFMVMEKLSLYDEITLSEIPSGIELALEGEGLDAGMAAEKNLACRAAVLFKEAAEEIRGVRVLLKKRIPVAAGLGGGSSDAAAVLRGLNKLWRMNWPTEKLAALGAKLGADVPFFCFDGPAVAEGRGEIITPLNALPKLFFLLINPGFAVSTPWVYKEFDRLWSNQESRVAGYGPLELTAPHKGASNPSPYNYKEFRDVVQNLRNDLEMATIASYPEIGEIKSYLVNQGARGSLMSGSGPTVFGIFEDEKTRNQAINKITKKNWKVYAAENV
jgi:4-diphosphocytidyl-2-C-methyl-D-erythritol kinase